MKSLRVANRRSLRRGPYWIESLHLTHTDKRNIMQNTDVDDLIIHTSLKLIQHQYPLIVIQPPSVYNTAAGFDYCPHETIQIVHNGANHWLLLSSLSGNIVIFDSLNTRPTHVLMKQIKQLFSPDGVTPRYRQVSCHQQLGSTDCGIFAIAYSVDLLCGIRPNDVIYDQSKMRKHLIRCLEVGVIRQFPRYGYSSALLTPLGSDCKSSWIQRRRSRRQRRRQRKRQLTTQEATVYSTSQYDTNDNGDFVQSQPRKRLLYKSVIGILKTLAVYHFPRRKEVSNLAVSVNFK